MSTLVISDVHLCGVVPNGGSYLAYRQPRNLLDAELASLILAAQADEIVFNGDVFDFDAPDLRTNVRDRSEAAAVSLVAAILDDHPLVVDAIRRSRSRLIFLPGNHDAQLAYPSVQAVIRARLGSATFAEFYATADGFYIEHGHQYDPLCSNDGPGDETIGTVVTYYTPLLFGCASPYASDPGDTGGWIAGLCGCASTDVAMACLRDLLLVRATPRAAGDTRAVKTLASGVVESQAWASYGIEAQRRLREAQLQIARMYGARGVVMGHTHVPYGVENGGVWYGNSGSWVSRMPSYVWIENGRAETRFYR